MKEPIIKLKDLYFSFDSITVFSSLNLEVYEGDRIGLIGPNGSGKTTLLQIIMGLLKPQAGFVEIFGKIRRKEKDFLDVRQKIGFLFQDSDNQIFCPTVKEEIAFGPLNLGKTKKEAEEIVKKTCEILGLRGFENRVTYKLSGGEKRLLALATVIAMQPICYLLDEPSTGLDEETSERIINFLKTNANTYIIVSHDRNFIERTTKKRYYLSKGELKEV